MVLSVLIESPLTSTQLTARFDSAVRSFSAAYERRREGAAIPDPQVTCVLTDDFVAVVNGYLAESEWRADEMTAGEAFAKTIILAEDHSRFAVVFDGARWHPGRDVEESLPFGLLMVAHELAHPLLYVTRWAAGLAVREPTALENVLADLVFGLADEYRAQRLGEVELGRVVTVGLGDAAEPYRSLSGLLPRYAATIQPLVQRAAEWPETVRQRAASAVPSGEVLAALASAVWAVLDQVVRVQALADADGTNEDVFALLGIDELPATTRYLAEPVRPFVTALNELPLISPASRAAKDTADLIAVGTGMFRAILGRLGIREAGGPDGATVIVVEPPEE